MRDIPERLTDPIYVLFLGRTYAQKVEHSLVLVARSTESTNEMLRPGHFFGKGTNTREHFWARDVAHEYDNLEARVGGEMVVDVHGPDICGLHERVWDHAFADDEPSSARLARGAYDRRGRVPDPDSACEATERLEHSVRALG